MLIVRDKQMHVLTEYMDKSFEKRMLVHINKHFEDQVGELGEEKVRQAIRHGMTKASEYALESERDVCWYIDMMFFFGHDFDVDTEFPWAAEILTDVSIEGLAAKASRLREEAERHELQARGLLKGLA